MKKRVLSVFLTMVIVIGFIPGGMLSASAAASGDGWSLDGDGVLTIMNNNGMTDWARNGRTEANINAVREVVIQDGVMRMDASAFRGCTNLTSVTIGNSFYINMSLGFEGCLLLTEIKVSANNSYFTDIDGVLFNKTATTLVRHPPGREGSYTIPDSVKTIGRYAFLDCIELTSVSIGNHVETIENSAFNGCRKLTSVSIGNRVETIENNAFNGCTGLTEITIPDSVTSIEFAAFKNCANLTKITIPDSVTSIGLDTFSDTALLNNHPNGVVYVGNWVIGYKGEMLPNTSITLRDDTRGIADDAFRGQTNLTSITIPDSVKNIGGHAFRSCTGLTEIKVSANNQNFSDIDGVLFDKAAESLILYPAGREGSYAIPDSVTSIGSWAFYNHLKLTSVTIGNSVTSIGDYAFYGCTGLTEIIIPDSVISIGGSAFSRCTGLTSLSFKSQMPPGFFTTSVFWNVPSNMTVFVPFGAKASYEAESELSRFNIVEIFFPCGERCKGEGDCNDPCERVITVFGVDWTLDNGGLLVIASDAGMRDWVNNGRNVYRNVVREIVIQDGVTSIGDSAFSRCTGLTKIIIPDSVTSINLWAFYGCTGLTEITIPDSVTSIIYAFSGCTGLREIKVSTNNQVFADIDGVLFNKTATTLVQYPLGRQGSYSIPDSVTRIGSEAFRGCTGLSEIIIPDSVTSIGYHAFFNTALFNNQPNGVVYAGNWVIDYKGTMPSLTFIWLRDDTRGIADDAFLEQTNLTYISIPDSVTSIGNYAFEHCTGLTHVVIGTGLTSIGSSAFNRCTELKSMIFKSRIPPSFATSVFNNVPSSMIVYVQLGRKAAYSAVSQLSRFNIVENFFSCGDYCKGESECDEPCGLSPVFEPCGDHCKGSGECDEPCEVKLPPVFEPCGLDCKGEGECDEPCGLPPVFEPCGEHCKGEGDCDEPCEAPPVFEPCGEHCKGEGECDEPCEAPPIFEPCGEHCKGKGECDEPCEAPPIFEPCGEHCKGEGECDEPCEAPPIFEPCGNHCKGEGECDEPCELPPVFEPCGEDCKGEGECDEPCELPPVFEPCGEHCKGEGECDEPCELPPVFEPCGEHCKGEGECDEPCKRIIAFGVDWTLDDSGLLVIESDAGMTDWTNIGRIVDANRNAVREVVIQEGVTSIESLAFSDCTGLTSVTIGNGVTSIGEYAFYYCTGLTSVTIGSGVTSIGDWAFYYCTGLTEITIPDSVTSIGGRAFDSCNGLTSVTIGDKVESIDDLAFSNCTGLTEITIPDSVTSIGSYAFYNCTGLTEITIPDSVISIGSYAFSNCTGLKNIIIGNGVTSIGFWAFYGCTELTNMTFKSQTPPLFAFDVFLYVPSNAIIYVPIGAKAAYQAESELSRFNIVEIFFPCGDHCKGEGECDEPCELPPVFEPCGEDCKGEGECDEPCEIPPEYALGDCNNDGVINIADLTYLKWAIVKTLPETPECFIAGNSTIGAADITLLRNFLTGKISSL